MDGNWNVKIADFGLARLTTEDLKNGGTLQKLRGTYSYCAPEIFNGQTFTTKSDIFSVGVIIWEIITRIVTGKYCRPYSEYPELQFDFQVIVQTSRGKRCTIPENTPESIADLIAKCWDNEPDNRPSSKELITSFSALYNEYKENREYWDATYVKKKI